MALIMLPTILRHCTAHYMGWRMDQESKLPDPKVCRTRRMYDTQFYLCLVQAPINCPYLKVVREFHICNHYFKSDFSEGNYPTR